MKVEVKRELSDFAEGKFELSIAGRGREQEIKN